MGVYVELTILAIVVCVLGIRAAEYRLRGLSWAPSTGTPARTLSPLPTRGSVAHGRVLTGPGWG